MAKMTDFLKIKDVVSSVIDDMGVQIQQAAESILEFDAWANRKRTVDLKVQMQPTINTGMAEEIPNIFNQASEALQTVCSKAGNIESYLLQINSFLQSGRKEASALSTYLMGFIHKIPKIGFLQDAANFVLGVSKEYDMQAIAESKLIRMTQLRMHATDQMTKSVKELIAEQQKIGVVKADLQMLGAEQMGQYLTDINALTVLIPAMNDVAVDTYGLTVTASAIKKIGAQMGMVMQGNAAMVGNQKIAIPDAEKVRFQNGTEEEKANILVKILENQMGSTNQIMTNLSQGEVINLSNQWRELTKQVAGEVYPVFMQFLQLCTEHMPMIQSIVLGIANAFHGLIDTMNFGFQAVDSIITGIKEGLSSILDFARNILEGLSRLGSDFDIIQVALTDFVGIFSIIEEAFSGNSDAIAAIIWGIVGAIAAYNIMVGIAAIATNGFFATLLSNPIAWIAVAIGLVVMAIYRFIESVGGVEVAFLIMVDFVLTAVNTIRIALSKVFLWIMQKSFAMVLTVMSAFVSFVNFVEDMKVNVLTILQAMVNGAVSIINAFIEKLNAIPGISISVVDKVTFASEEAIKKEAQKQHREEMIHRLSQGYDKIYGQAEGKFHLMVEQAEKDSLARANAIEVKRLATELQEEKPNINPEVTGVSSPNWDSLAMNSANTAGNTERMADTMDTEKEDMQYLRDLAEREAINRFTTAELKVEMTNHNNIKDARNANDLISVITRGVEEAMASMAEGVCYE